MSKKITKKAAGEKPGMEGNLNGATEVVFCFDTTGSMAPCIADVRAKVKSSVEKMFKEISGLKVGILTHGDYCDDQLYRGPGVYTKLDLTNSCDKVVSHINTAPNTGGGDSPECYELMLHIAQDMGWSKKKKGAGRALVMIGDDEPHPKGYSYSGVVKAEYDWTEEAKKLAKLGVTVYSLQCLATRHHNLFLKQLADLAGTPLLLLDQFTDSAVTLGAIAHHTYGGGSSVMSYAASIPTSDVTGGVLRTMSALAGREVTVAGHKTYVGKTDKSEFRPIPREHFKRVSVLSDGEGIRDFCNRMIGSFKTGWAFYQLTKPVLVQDYKRVVVRHKDSDEYYTGSNARRALDLPEVGAVKLKPSKDSKFEFFIQSTSVNRVLKPNTEMLYGDPNV